MFEKYDFRVMLDFTSGTTSTPSNNGFVQEAYVNARFHPGFQVQAGKFKEPVGLERLQSGRKLLFVERGYPTPLVPNRDVGVQVQGDLLGRSLSYAAGVFNEVADGGSGDLETYVISEQQVRSDAAASTFPTLRHAAWQAAVSYLLTGEENSFKALHPRNPFNPANGGWGAWELTARFGELTLDPETFPLYASPTASARKASSWGVGMNWHLNKSVKLNLNYEQTHFQGGDAPLFDQGEHVFLTRVQVSF